MRFDPERQSCNGRKHQGIGDEQISLNIKRGAEKISRYNSDERKQTDESFHLRVHLGNLRLCLIKECAMELAHSHWNGGNYRG